MVRASENKITVLGSAGLNICMRPPFDLAKLRASLPLQQQLSILSKAERAVLLPHTVEQTTLSEDSLGQRRFCQELRIRMDWIADNCLHPHLIETIRDNQLRLTGRRFRFADADEAFAFRMRF